MNKYIHANCLFINQKYEEAFKLYMDCVNEDEDARAFSNIGYMYHRGIGVERDYGKAISYYTVASYHDGGVAFYNLSLMYMRGEGVRVNLEKALDYMKKSAAEGSPDAKLYLGLAYMMGYLYDPVAIECLSLIPFPRVIYKEPDLILLGGEGNDEIENERYEVIAHDEFEAIDIYKSLTNDHEEDPYHEAIVASAKLTLGTAMLNGVGNELNPEKAFALIQSAAIKNYSAEAAAFIAQNQDEAQYYGVDMEKFNHLLNSDYFNRGSGSLNVPESHKRANFAKKSTTKKLEDKK